MRGTTKILIAFGVVFVVASGASFFIISHVTSSITSNAFRTRDPASAMSGMGSTILLAAVSNRTGQVVTPGGNFAIPGVEGAMRATAVRSTEDIVAQGERAEGTIQAVSHTGATAGQMAPGAKLDADKADDPMIYVALQVQPRQGAAFASQGILRVPKRKLAALAIGRKVPVAFLPGQPETATIDWARL